jgi:hypothetical protein
MRVFSSASTAAIARAMIAGSVHTPRCGPKYQLALVMTQRDGF